jgi:hypothetical protein
MRMKCQVHLELWNMKHGQAWKRMVDLFYIYRGNLVFSFTSTKGNIKDIHIHLHDLTLNTYLILPSQHWSPPTYTIA